MRKFLGTMLTICFACVFAPGQASSQGVARQLGDMVAHCTEQHGYDVRQSAGLSDYELGNNELAWRQCMYDGIRVNLVPETPAAHLLEELIDRDKRLTEQLSARKITRKDRRVQNMRAIMEIQAYENDYLTARGKQLLDIAKTDAAIQDTQRILDAQRRVFEIQRSALEGLR